MKIWEYCNENCQLWKSLEHITLKFLQLLPQFLSHFSNNWIILIFSNVILFFYICKSYTCNNRQNKNKIYRTTVHSLAGAIKVTAFNRCVNKNEEEFTLRRTFHIRQVVATNLFIFVISLPHCKRKIFRH